MLAEYVRPDELQQSFNFDLLLASWSAAKFRTIIDRTRSALATVGGVPTWVLSNHDAVRHVTRYGGGELGVARARAGLLLVLALPGSTYLYQGEELGLPQAVVPDDAKQDPEFIRSGGKKPGRDGCRVPLPWAGSEPPYGFSPPGAADPWLPQPAEWAAHTVEAESRDARSTLSLYRTALRLRRKHVHGLAGDFRWLDSPRGVLAFARGPLSCVVNFGSRAARLPAYREVLLSSAPLGRADRLPPNTAAWLR